MSVGTLDSTVGFTVVCRLESAVSPNTNPLPTAPTLPAARGARASVRRRRVDNVRRASIASELESLILREGFTSLTVDDMARHLRCSKSTLYSIAPSKEQLVVAITKGFFREAAVSIENAILAEADPARRIATYLDGVGSAMNRCSQSYYVDLNSFAPTLAVYERNAQTAARRVQELIEAGVEAKALRSSDSRFAGQFVALAIDGVLSGALLNPTGLTAGQAFAEIGNLILNGLSATGAQGH
ncbi:TetR family transcriptional regulator [metagenome]|uniref:TetR family transcriptional regulator n=1 Tax=metagenome TaxID=256318 RepID=A0A2P2C3Z5_9ZZZZ